MNGMLVRRVSQISGVTMAVLASVLGFSCKQPVAELASRSRSALGRPAVILLASAAAPQAKVAPFLLHLPGIGGKRSIDVGLTRGLVQGGFNGDLQIYDWTDGDPGIDALHSMARNHQKAKRVAEQLTTRFDAAPAVPLYLTCHSGGAGLAVWALEALPARVKVKAVLFMAPALSPTYDLSAALSHVSGHAYVFSSSADAVVLGLGTRLFGTIDGVSTDAAGLKGFVRPVSGIAGQYAKLVSLPYQTNWVQLHNYGEHVGGMNRAFARVLLAPLLLSDTRPTAVQEQAATAPIRPTPTTQTVSLHK